MSIISNFSNLQIWIIPKDHYFFLDKIIKFEQSFSHYFMCKKRLFICSVLWISTTSSVRNMKIQTSKVSVYEKWVSSAAKIQVVRCLCGYPEVSAAGFHPPTILYMLHTALVLLLLKHQLSNDKKIKSFVKLDVIAWRVTQELITRSNCLFCIEWLRQGHWT